MLFDARPSYGNASDVSRRPPENAKTASMRSSTAGRWVTTIMVRPVDNWNNRRSAGPEWRLYPTAREFRLIPCRYTNNHDSGSCGYYVSIRLR